LGGPQGRSGSSGEKKSAPSRNQTPDVQLVARRYTDWTIPGHLPYKTTCNIIVLYISILIFSDYAEASFMKIDLLLQKLDTEIGR
jgi:hypothetical protein